LELIEAFSLSISSISILTGELQTLLSGVVEVEVVAEFEVEAAVLEVDALFLLFSSFCFSFFFSFSFCFSFLFFLFCFGEGLLLLSSCPFSLCL
jgi:hypothetical protein